MTTTTFQSRFLVTLCLLLSLTTTPVMAADELVDWRIPPSGSSLTNLTMQSGDTITFAWRGTHNLNLWPSGQCDDSTGRVTLAFTNAGQNNQNYSYTYVQGDVGKTLTYTCTVSGHCAQGQIMSVTVEQGPSLSPTSSPTPTSGSNTIGGSSTMSLVAGSMVMAMVMWSVVV